MSDRIDFISKLIPDCFVPITCIPDIESMYGVSRDGRIFSIRSMRELKPSFNNFGYHQVYLTYFHGGGRWFKLHRIVAMQFLPNENCFTDVNHINCVKTDNFVENLEWCSHSDNIKHSYANGRKHDSSHLRKKIYCVSNNTVYDSLKSAADDTGCFSSNISNCCKGKVKSTKGFIFKYHHI